MPRLRPSAVRPIWRKSSYSLANGECVEVAVFDGDIIVRDSKDKLGVRLHCRTAAWREFLATIKK
jgi:hypothetical protein